MKHPWGPPLACALTIGITAFVVVPALHSNPAPDHPVTAPSSLPQLEGVSLEAHPSIETGTELAVIPSARAERPSSLPQSPPAEALVVAATLLRPTPTVGWGEGRAVSRRPDVNEPATREGSATEGRARSRVLPTPTAKSGPRQGKALQPVVAPAGLDPTEWAGR